MHQRRQGLFLAPKWQFLLSLSSALLWRSLYARKRQRPRWRHPAQRARDSALGAESMCALPGVRNSLARKTFGVAFLPVETSPSLESFIKPGEASPWRGILLAVAGPSGPARGTLVPTMLTNNSINGRTDYTVIGSTKRKFQISLGH